MVFVKRQFSSIKRQLLFSQIHTSQLGQYHRRLTYDCYTAVSKRDNRIIFTYETSEVPESRFLKLAHVSHFPWIVQNWKWHIFWGIASEMLQWLQSKWFWNVARRNKFSSSTLLSNYLGQEVAMTYRSLCARPRSASWSRVLKKFKYLDCVWAPILFSFSLLL